MVRKSGNIYYEESLKLLIEYLKENEQNPNESIWDKYAVKNNCLSSKSMGYIFGCGFNKMCKKLRKELNKNKRKSL